MAEVDLDGVEARVDEHPCAGAVELGDRVQVGGRDGLRAPHPQGAEHARRRDARVLGARGVRHRSGVADLRGRGRALGVDRVGQLLQTRADLGVVERELVTVGAAGTRDRAVRDRRHPRATGGDAAMELDEILGHHPLRRAPFEGRGFDDAIAQRHGAEAGRFERGRCAHGGHATARARRNACADHA